MSDGRAIRHFHRIFPLLSSNRFRVNFPEAEPADDGVLHASLGPFAPETLREVDSGGGLGLSRVLDTVCDTHEIEERKDGAWVELTKRVAG